MTNNNYYRDLFIISDKRLKSRIQFEEVYSKGTNIYSADKTIKARYCLLNEILKPKFQFAITISSKAGNAVWRNRIKRVINEASRPELKYFREKMSNKNLSLLVIFSTSKLKQQTNKYVFLRDIQPAVLGIMEKLRCMINEV